MPSFALVDCNNFYASCERVFKPQLEKQPIVVLSNNDGCVIARSNEAKKLGITMAAPYFKIQRFCRQHHVAVFSSNYALYGDMSQRVMMTLENACPDIEIYSIDEAFLDLSAWSHLNAMGFAGRIKQQVQQHVGIPVCIGIGPTKTLAKLANHIAKKHTHQGLFDLSHPTSQQYWLKQLPVGTIWGVGKRLETALTKLGIHTALELKLTNSSWLRKRFGIALERLQCELHGIACHQIEQPTPRQSILSSRTFNTPQTELSTVAEALANYTATACEKLRQQHSTTRHLSIFLHTKRDPASGRNTQHSTVVNLPTASCDTRDILRYAKYALASLFQPGQSYQKVGILLMGLDHQKKHQGNLLTKCSLRDNPKLMHTLDHINHRLGRGKLFFAAQGTQRHWHSQSSHRSPHYTTNWSELLTIK